VYTSTTGSSGQLVVDSALFSKGAELKDSEMLTRASAEAPLGQVRNPSGLPAGETAIDLFWHEPVNDGQSAVVRYEVAYGEVTTNAFGSMFADDAAPGARVTGLVPGKTYQFKIRAFNGLGHAGPYSRVILVTTENGNDVAWTRGVGVEIRGNLMAKNAPLAGWNAGGSSVNVLAGNGYFEFTVPQADKYMMAGLSDADVDTGYASIDYAIFFDYRGVLAVFESGVMKTELAWEYRPGDVFRIERAGTVITYKRNGQMFYTSSASSSGALIADVSIHGPDAAMTHAQIVNK
jgi:hypothetical protein